MARTTALSPEENRLEKTNVAIASRLSTKHVSVLPPSERLSSGLSHVVFLHSGALGCFRPAASAGRIFLLDSESKACFCWLNLRRPPVMSRSRSSPLLRGICR